MLRDRRQVSYCLNLKVVEIVYVGGQVMIGRTHGPDPEFGGFLKIHRPVHRRPSEVHYLCRVPRILVWLRRL